MEGEGIAEARSAALPSLVDAAPGLTCPWLGIYGEPGDGERPELKQLRDAASSSEVATNVVVYPARGHGSTTIRTWPPTLGSAPSTGSTRTCAESAPQGVVNQSGFRVYPDDRGGDGRRRSGRPREASPSPVYGAALLMRFGLTPIPGSNPGASAWVKTIDGRAGQLKIARP